MDKRVILASNSPRRQELLRNLGIEFDVIPDNTPETISRELTPDEIVCTLAKFKGDNVISNLDKDTDALVISADTVVAVDDKVLGKPVNKEDAVRMLSELSGRAHYVYTGVYIRDILLGNSVFFYEKTEVFFKKLDIIEIKDYINTGEPMDKAGAYGIQNLGSLFVEKINGDYFNVVGLPVCRLCKVLKEDFNFRVF